MPFDAPNYAARYATPADDTPYARRRTLIVALRAEDLAQRWRWDFLHVRNECGTAGCAIGLAMGLWDKDSFSAHGPYIDDDGQQYWAILFRSVAAFFDLSEQDARRIFGTTDFQQDYKVHDINQVTPAMVADALEATLPESER